MPLTLRFREGVRLLPVGKVVFCLALSVAALSVRPAWCQETVALSGQVQTSDGHTISSGVNLRLETLQGTPVEAQPANPGGEFEFTGLRRDSYRLRVSAEGFQTLEQEVDLRFTAGRVVVNLFLTPVGQSKSVEAASAVLTDQLAPKKARDELTKGARALSKEKYSDARTHLEKAIAEYPCYARAQTDLAIALVQLLALTQAESALRKSIKCDPGYHPARLVLGQLLNMQRRFEESEKVLTEAVRLAPGSWQLYYRLGIADFGLGEYARSVEEYEKVLSFNPTPPSDYYVKAADAYLAQEAYDKAYAKMQDYLRIDPDGRFAEKIRRTVRQMEADGVLSKSMESAAQPNNQ